MSLTYQLGLHVSDDEHSSYETSRPATTSKRRMWIRTVVLDDGRAAREWCETEKTWAAIQTTESRAGTKVLYRCNRVKKRGPQCAKQMYLLYHSEDQRVSVYKSANEHTHDEINKKASKYGICSHTKEIIDRLLQQGKKKKNVATNSCENTMKTYEA